MPCAIMVSGLPRNPRCVAGVMFFQVPASSAGAVAGSALFTATEQRVVWAPPPEPPDAVPAAPPVPLLLVPAAEASWPPAPAPLASLPPLGVAALPACAPELEPALAWAPA